MDQSAAEKLKDEFFNLTMIEVSIKFMRKGITHQPSTLPNGKQGVYVFLTETKCLKVGKAGSKSKARWNSHHYNLDKSTPSTLTKSIIKNKEQFKLLFPENKRDEIDQLNKSNISNWIRNNISRIEYVMPEDSDNFSLNLLEALIQFRLKPFFEGKKS